MRIGLAYDAFYCSISNFIPNLEIIDKDVSNFDMVIFSGGEDINPRIYSRENTHSSYNDKRDNIELKILDQAMSLNKKILGICRGHQLINSFLGGNLYQDLFFDFGCSHPGNHELSPISTRFASIVPKFFTEVNSMHHQGVFEKGSGLYCTSAYKGIPESLEDTNNIITVQFHPEFMSESKSGKFWKFLLEHWIKGEDISENKEEEEQNNRINLETGTFRLRNILNDTNTTRYNTTRYSIFDDNGNISEEPEETYVEEEENEEDTF